MNSSTPPRFSPPRNAVACVRRSTVFVALALAGCVTYEPLPLAPQAELAALRGRNVADVRQEDMSPTEGETLRVEFDPRDGIDEAELVALALTLNPDLQVARSEIGEAQALLISASLLPNPSVSAGWRSGIAGAPGYSADLDLLFSLLRPRERELRRHVAEARIAEARARVWSAEWNLVGHVRLARLDVWQRRRTLEIARLNSDLRRRLLESARASQEIGDSSRLEVMFAELELAEADLAVTRAETESARARSTLNELIGLPESTTIQLADLDLPLVVRPVADSVADVDLESRVVAGRPEVRELEASYRTAERELELAVQRQYPSVVVGPSFGREPEHESYLGLALGIELPLFDRNQGEIAEKEKHRQTLRDVYRSMLHHSVAAARRTLALAQAMKREFDARNLESVPRADRLSELTSEALRSRDISVLEWIQAQRSILESRTAFLDSAVAYQRAVIEFEAAIGSFASMGSATGPKPRDGAPDDPR